MAENIIYTGSILTALGIIVSTAVKLHRFLRKWEIWVEETKEHSKDNYMSVLQLKIMSPFMPLTERIKAGDKYVELGGNGEVKQKYYELLGMLPKEKEIL